VDLLPRLAVAGDAVDPGVLEEPGIVGGGLFGLVVEPQAGVMGWMVGMASLLVR
jgi:hypothetical protein